MTTAAVPTTVPARAGSARRVRSLARMELTLLGRNKTALVNSLAIAPVMVLLLMGVIEDRSDAGGFAGTMLVALAGFALLFVAYYNLTTTAVARREELTLKRLTSGEVSRGEALVGMALPAAAVVAGQVLLGGIALAMGFGGIPLVNPVLVVVALGLGFAVLALLAYASSGLTKTVESAQLTTLPVLFVAMLLSDLTVPLDVLPDPVAQVAGFTPLAPVVTLLQLGLAGTGPDGEQLALAQTFGEALPPVLVLVAWIALGVAATRRWMRWEPRR